MALYKRFVTYLFLYEDMRKGKNCGFAKVDARQGRCRIEIQMKGCPDGKYLVYLLHHNDQNLTKDRINEMEEKEAAEDEAVEKELPEAVNGINRTDRKPEGLEIGAICVEDGFGSAVYIVDAEKISGTDFGLEDVFGIYLTADGSGFIASQWEDGEVDWGSFRAYDRETPKECIAKGTVREGTEEVIDNSEKTVIENPEVQATQTAVATDISPYLAAWEKQWQQFCARHPVFCPFDEIKNTYAVKVDLRDLRKLPKQYRPLANNSFLLHGYFSYQYLLFGCEDREEKRWFVAVPGIFQNQEQLMAGIFGFTEFRTKQVTKQKTGEFGYWYRYLEM